MTDIHDDDLSAVDLLGDLQFIFAIGDLDPRLGRITVEKVSWPSDEQGSGIKDRTRETIEMVSCRKLIEETKQRGEEFLVNPNFKPYDNYMRFIDPLLCPNTTSLRI